jgi:hypothetical protein
MKAIITTIVLSAGIVLVPRIQAEPTLKEAFKNNFLIGAALNPSQFCFANQMSWARRW